MNLEGLSIKELEAKYRARRYSYNKRKTLGVDTPKVKRLQDEMNQIQTKINELKGNGYGL